MITDYVWSVFLQEQSEHGTEMADVGHVCTKIGAYSMSHVCMY